MVCRAINTTQTIYIYIYMYIYIYIHTLARSKVAPYFNMLQFYFLLVHVHVLVDTSVCLC